MVLFRNQQKICESNDIREIIVALVVWQKNHNIPSENICFIKMPDVGDNYDGFIICKEKPDNIYLLKVGGENG